MGTTNSTMVNDLISISRNLSRAQSQGELETLMFDSFGLFISSGFEITYWNFDSNKNALTPTLFGGLMEVEKEDLIYNEVPQVFQKTFYQRKAKNIKDCKNDDLGIPLKETLFYKNGSLLIIPAFLGDEVVGIVSIYVSEKDFFDETTENTLTLVSNMLCNAYEVLKTKTRHFDKLEDYIVNEAFNKSVVEYGSDIVIILDPKGIILYHNPSSEETLGYAHGFLVGKSFFDFIHEESLGDIQTFFYKSISNSKSQKIEYKFKAENGDYVYLESNSINLFEKEGVEGLILDSRDITEKISINEEVQKQQQFIQQVIDTDPNLIYVKDWEGKLLLINQAVADMHGATKESVIKILNSQPIERPEDLYNESKEDSEAILGGKEIMVEESFTFPDGEVRWFQTTKKALFREGRKAEMLSISMDITERKRNAEELLKAQKAKEQFLANMSHEIRTPINGIAGLINLLFDADPTTEQREYLTGIHNSAENLKVIINDILDISKIESGKLNFEKKAFIPESQIKSVIETFKYRTDEKGLDLILEIEDEAREIVVLGDPVRFSQILMNLIGNAVKFTYSGHIKITTGIESYQGNTVRVKFSVSDTGIGIPTDKMETVFDSFRQADESVSRKFGGTGLGLTICKQLVEYQGGEISVDSVEHKGTTFSFIIPYEKADRLDLNDLNNHQDSKFRIKEMGSFDGLSILLVEDNDINQMYSSNILKKWDCKVDVAGNGAIAIEKVKKNNYDLILMDIQMPVMDGYEATRNIRNNLSLPKSQVPIIALTANAIVGDNDKCLDIGMNDYLAKPFAPEDLFNKILQIIKPNIEKLVEKRVVSDSIKSVSLNKKSIVDLSYLKYISENDNEFMGEMISSFIENNPILLSELKTFASESNWIEVGKVAHKIKPTLVLMGINTIKEDIETIESNGRKSLEVKTIPTLIEKIDEVCIKAIHELQIELESLTAIQQA